MADTPDARETYKNAKVSEACENFRIAYGSRSAREFRKDLEASLLAAPCEITYVQWTQFVDALVAGTVLNKVHAKYKFMPKKYKASITPESVYEKCRICGIDDENARWLIQRYLPN